jgi:hypothetical protein
MNVPRRSALRATDDARIYPTQHIIQALVHHRSADKQTETVAYRPIGKAVARAASACRDAGRIRAGDI